MDSFSSLHVVSEVVSQSDFDVKNFKLPFMFLRNIDASSFCLKSGGSRISFARFVQFIEWCVAVASIGSFEFY
jgi:hypothetical protein